MNYQETLDYLYSKLPLFSRVGAAAYKPSLDNTISLLRVCGNPETKFPSIHVAGTNGKGSVSHMLAAILHTAGFRTGLYTSPHLHDFRERIRINGEMIPEQAVIDFTANLAPAVEEIEPSFFELTVAMAFHHFAEQQVDIAVIETGLGGRLDSTNVITPLVSVITNIGWDHMNLLGDSLEKIAREKAGIIKPGVPVVIGESIPETKPVFEVAAKAANAPIHYPSTHRAVEEWYWENDMLIVAVASTHEPDHEIYHLDLGGIYQSRNLLTVLETISQLQQQGWAISKQHTRKALANVKKLTGLHGRWDIIHRQPLVVLDVAHNEAGITVLMQQLETTPHEHLHIVIGMVADKDIDKVLALLPQTAAYYFTNAAIPRALPGVALQEKAARFGLSGETYANVNEALQAARQRASSKDLVLVCGSVFVVGEVMVNT